MSSGENRLEEERTLISDAQGKGPMATLAVYTKLSGPGWLQSAITLGGGSLAGALFLGILGGTSLLWLQLVAITMGVIMLSAISYVTLSTGERPFRAINEHINPVLGWGWIIATMLANMIWCMPQFSLCFAALQKNLLGSDVVDDSSQTKFIVSGVILVASAIAVFLNSRQGKAAKAFDWFLKFLVGIVVICFVGVVGLLTLKGSLDWSAILTGFVPDLSQWGTPTGKIAELITTLPQQYQDFWTTKVVAAQREVMIGAAATAVGINMTFLMPYSLLKRGWDRSFRGLSRFDLSTGMAIPYVLVTSCVVIATAAQFHAQVDSAFLSTDPAIMQTSSLFSGAQASLEARVSLDGTEAGSADETLNQIAALSNAEKTIASSLVKRSAFDLSTAIAPLLGDKTARIAFGLGIFGMGFSSIIILMLINGFAVCEIANRDLGGGTHVIGCLIAGITGALWPLFWAGDSKVYLAIIASSFGMMLLPIAYVTFFMMMNSTKLLGDDKPSGLNRIVWNVLMGLSVAGAVVAATSAIQSKLNDATAGPIVITMAVVFIIAVIIGFIRKQQT
ncbi:MAG: divalent metal cation transporter [Fuerstiella sp.]|jgi:Mn2+/Fe2+ NRAMP family transporter|nr:divalent metal cation transporter [Fuerstiella sp.]